MSGDRREARLDRLRTSLGQRGLDALIVSHPPNIRYLTGFTGTSALVVVGSREPVLYSDFRYTEQAAQEVGNLARVEIVERDLWAKAIRTLTEAPRVAVVGYEAERLSVTAGNRLVDEAGGVDVRPTTDLVEALRRQKDAGEIASIAEAARLACETLAVVLETVRVGQRELDVAATLEYQLRLRGSEWHPFHTIVASGPRSALPHARTTERTVESGDWLLLDFGAQVDGYCADVTRTVVVGRAADERQRSVYELVREAQTRAVEHVRAGMTGREADALARSTIEARGFGEQFGHSLGHGLGLEVHEGPSLGRANEQEIPVDAVVTVEPGIYVPGWGGVRIEDDVHITADGATLLSDGQTGLQELL